MPDSKQILIDGDLHRRLKAHVASLGVSTMKSYVETVLEHAMLTNGQPLQVVEPPIVAQEPEPAPDPEPEPEPGPEPEPTVEPDPPPVVPTVEEPPTERPKDPWGGAISAPPKGATNDW